MIKAQEAIEDGKYQEAWDHLEAGFLYLEEVEQHGLDTR